ncbi:MAG: protein translocase SEC61 complex subunit gamma [Candidatus Aenigmatarchaeota archaeon]
MKFNIKEFLEKYKRVLIVAKRPDKEELLLTIKICLIGMGIIGFIGFLIYMISILFIG